MTEDNAFDGPLGRALRREFVNEHLDLGGGGPVRHLDPVDDAGFLDCRLILFALLLLEIDRQRYVATRTVWIGLSVCEIVDEAAYARATEVMAAGRSDGIFSNVVADGADEDILTALGVLLGDHVRMVSHLAHLHDQAEDVGVVIEHHSLGNIGVEGTVSVGHD